eukprot:TRINITY_DN5438_c0_g1_i8.p2 TRINITY_DN5438_c0_g1~~TRINITY_DN5438_c0_g1_i8.p2  ORF type:complete len:144 (+),score=14.35 TRINITY_DN5438_c0_g1_i8:154-585(+)
MPINIQYQNESDNQQSNLKLKLPEPKAKPSIIELDDNLNPKQGFSPKKALKGIFNNKEVHTENKSACTQRGDGKFENGELIKQLGNFAYIAPSALSPENQEETLKLLDQFQKGPKQQINPQNQQQKIQKRLQKNRSPSRQLNV